jgi:hypothetical protein
MCQKEWKNLRDRFNKENKTRSGAKAPASKWAYYAAMLFYGKHFYPDDKPGMSTDMESRPSSSCSSVWLTIDTVWSPEQPEMTAESD